MEYVAAELFVEKALIDRDRIVFRRRRFWRSSWTKSGDVLGILGVAGGRGDERRRCDAQSSVDIEEFICFPAEGADVGERIE